MSLPDPVSCSQTVAQRRPARRARARFRRSLRRFAAIFAGQKFRPVNDDLGARKCLGHPCQKHPSTKRAIPPSTRKSGEPGAPGWGACRSPMRASAARTRLSGPVPEDRILRMSLDRDDLPRESAIHTLRRRRKADAP